MLIHIAIIGKGMAGEFWTWILDLAQVTHAFAVCLFVTIKARQDRLKHGLLETIVRHSHVRAACGVPHGCTAQAHNTANKCHNLPLPHDTNKQ
jgi:hypothetical protein